MTLPPNFHPSRVCHAVSAHQRSEIAAQRQGHCSRMAEAVAGEIEASRRSKLTSAERNLERLFNAARASDWSRLYEYELAHGLRKPGPQQPMYDTVVTPMPMEQPKSLIFYLP